MNLLIAVTNTLAPEVPPPLPLHVRLARGEPALWGAAAVGFGLAGCAWRWWTNRREQLRVTLCPSEEESIRVDSPEKDMSEPDCQVAIGYMVKENVMGIIGSGIRITVGEHHLLLTTLHNIKGKGNLWLIKGDKRVELEEPEIVPIETDAAVVKVSADVWSGLGVKIARLAAITSADQYVSIAGIAGKGSTGRLSCLARNFGHVAYDGTTQGGYSGAAYHVARSIYGMHVWGGARNAGYEILYLYACAKVELDVAEEDSEEIFLARLFSRQDAEYTVQEKGDKMIVRMGLYSTHGRYHVVDKRNFQRKEAEWQYGGEVEDDVREDEAAQNPILLEQALNYQRPGHHARAGNLNAAQVQQPQPAGLRRRMPLSRIGLRNMLESILAERLGERMANPNNLLQPIPEALPNGPAFGHNQ